jgi:hypothetical protein
MPAVYENNGYIWNKPVMGCYGQYWVFFVPDPCEEIQLNYCQQQNIKNSYGCIDIGCVLIRVFFCYFRL